MSWFKFKKRYRIPVIKFGELVYVEVGEQKILLKCTLLEIPISAPTTATLTSPLFNQKAIFND